MKLLSHFLASLLLIGAATFSPADSSRELDVLVEKGLAGKGVSPNAPITDAAFVRRIYLDIIGRIPTKKESETFLASDNPNNRSRLIDRLLNSDGYVSHYYHFWADLLRARSAINGNNQSLGTGRAYEQWIKTPLRENLPYDEMVSELITASGQSWENGAVGYYIRDFGMPLDNTAMTAQVFLGTQLVCAQCHDHPFDKWTQMDYFHLASFSYGMVTSNQLPDGGLAVRAAIEQMPKQISPEKQKDLNRAFSEILKPVRFNNVIETRRRPRLPHDYQYDDAAPRDIVFPKSIMGPEAVLSKAKHPTESLADWLTSPQNPRFAPVMSNRLWKKNIRDRADRTGRRHERSFQGIQSGLPELPRNPFQRTPL